MFSLLLLVLLGLAGADTDPRDFSRLCSSPAPGGECSVGWENVEGGLHHVRRMGQDQGQGGVCLSRRMFSLKKK